MKQNDEKIVRLCMKKSREGYRMLYEKFYRYVYSLCYKSTYHHEDALDLVQEVFLKVFSKLESFDPKKPLMPWIRRITINILVNHANRTPKNVFALDFNDEESQSLIGSAREEDLPERLIAGKETRGVIEQAVAQLPGNERTAVVLRHFEGKSYEEIARLMDCPLGTVKTYLYRARKVMRDYLKAQGVWEVS